MKLHHTVFSVSLSSIHQRIYISSILSFFPRIHWDYYYRQDLPEGQLCRYFVYSRVDFGFFSPRRGDTLHRSRSNLAGRSLAAKFDLDRFRGGGLRPQNWKNWNFTNIITPKGRIPCTIFTKFTIFMRVLSLHNFAKFGSFISINDKIISNLLRWGHFEPNFRCPLAAKLWMGPKKVWHPKKFAT